MKSWSRIALGVGIALLISGVVTLVFVSFRHPIAAGQLLVGFALVGLYLLVHRQGLARRLFGRATLFYGVSVLMAALLLGALAAANYAGARREIAWDFTVAGLHTLSDDTVRTLQNLPGPVLVQVFYAPSEAPYAAATELVTRYAAIAGENLIVEVIDPFSDPVRTRDADITQQGPRIAVHYEQAGSLATAVTEEALTNALVRVLNTRKQRIYALIGHDEGDTAVIDVPNGFHRVVKRLGAEGLELRQVSLAEVPEVPEDAAAVLVIAPRTPYFPSELETLDRYLARGGRVLFALEPTTADLGLLERLERYGVVAEPGVIVDPAAKVMGGGPMTPVVRTYGGHSIVNGATQTTLFPTVRPLLLTNLGTFRMEALAVTSPTAWQELRPDDLPLQRDEGERGGALPIAAAGRLPIDGGETEGRIVVFGDADFFNNQFHEAAGNADLFLNSVSWLASRDSRITIRPKVRESSRLLLTEADAALLNVFSMTALPLLLLAIGLSVWLFRKAM